MERNAQITDTNLHVQLRERTKQFALRIIRVWKSLPQSREAEVIGRQVLRSGTAVAANYRGRTLTVTR
jgi:hypothetical protein